MVPSNKKQLGYFEEIARVFLEYLFSINEEDWKTYKVQLFSVNHTNFLLLKYIQTLK